MFFLTDKSGGQVAQNPPPGALAGLYEFPHITRSTP